MGRTQPVAILQWGRYKLSEVGALPFLFATDPEDRSWSQQIFVERMVL